MIDKDTQDSKPRPDPTDLTTKQILLAVSSLRELIEARLRGFEQRLDANEETMSSYTEDARRISEEYMQSLRTLHEEKFRSIAVQFSERDTRTEQTSRDSKVAVDAALQAAKEAVAEQNRSSALAIAKSEAATTKQIDQQGTLIQTNTGALDGKINDVKERINKIEGAGTGVASAWAVLVAVIGIAFALVGVVLTIRAH